MKNKWQLLEEGFSSEEADDLLWEEADRRQQDDRDREVEKEYAK